MPRKPAPPVAHSTSKDNTNSSRRSKADKVKKKNTHHPTNVIAESLSILNESETSFNNKRSSSQCPIPFFAKKKGKKKGRAEKRRED